MPEELVTHRRGSARIINGELVYRAKIVTGAGPTETVIFRNRDHTDYRLSNLRVVPTWQLEDPGIDAKVSELTERGLKEAKATVESGTAEEEIEDFLWSLPDEEYPTGKTKKVINFDILRTEDVERPDF